MRVGIDATAIPNNPVGAGNYIVELIKALAGVELSTQLTIFHRRSSTRWFAELSDVHLISIPDYRPWRRLIWEQSQLPRLVRNLRLDLVHSPHYTIPLRNPGKSVVTFHDCTFLIYPEFHTLPKRIFFRYMMRQSAKKSDAIITVSENSRTDTLRLFSIPPSKVTTIPLGVSGQFRPLADKGIYFELEKKYRLPNDFLLFVGTIEPRKNLVTLIDAFDQLIGEGVALDLVLVGPLGWMYQAILRRIRLSSQSSRIHRLGYVDADDLVALYNMAEAFIYIPYYEGFGLPVLEALGCGTPVIASNVSSIPEIAGNAAILVDPTSMDEVLTGIKLALKNEEQRTQNTKAGISRASEFTWERTARSTIATYEAVLGGS